jgi:hypothetical protein
LSDTSCNFGDAYGGSIPATNNTAVVAGSVWINNSSLAIGFNGYSNRVLVTDSGSVQAPSLIVGFRGTGNQLIVSNSAAVIVNNLFSGGINSLNNSVTVSGGTITANNSIGFNGHGTLTINSGLLITPYLTTEANGSAGSEIILNGGTLQSGTTIYGNTMSFVVGNGIDPASFIMSNNGSHSFPGGVIVSSNGSVKGVGTIQANVSVNQGGNIAPGTINTGAITVNGNLALNPGSTTVMKLDASSGASDSLTGATNLAYGGTLQLTNISAALTAGKSFKLFGATNYFGAFSNLTPAAPGAGLRWDTNELNIDGVLRVFSTTKPAPTLGNITMANGSLTVSATGGIPFDPCYLLTSTNLTDWSYTATNYFDASGAASFTNAVAPAEPQQYFRVQVN